jgi:hypothetical protein
MRLTQADRCVDILHAVTGDVLCTLPGYVTLLEAKEHALRAKFNPSRLCVEDLSVDLLTPTGTLPLWSYTASGDAARLIDVLDGEELTLKAVFSNSTSDLRVTVGIMWNWQNRHWASVIPEAYIETSSNDSLQEILTDLPFIIDNAAEGHPHLCMGTEMWNASARKMQTKTLISVDGEGQMRNAKQFDVLSQLPLGSIISPNGVADEYGIKNDVYLMYDLANPSRAYLFENRHGMVIFAAEHNMRLNADVTNEDALMNDPRAPWFRAWHRYRTAMRRPAPPVLVGRPLMYYYLVQAPM